MKTKDAYNGSRRRGERFLRLWSELAQGVFPFITEEVGELDSEHRLFVSVCEAVIDPKEFEYAKWCGNGRPKADRVSIFKAYILKMTLNLKGDKELVALLRQQPLSRRLCGWGSAGLVPSRPSFCRAFAEFAERGFTEKWFADFIRKYHGDIPEETVSFDSAPVHVRAKVANAKRRLAKLDPDQQEPPPRLSCQGGQSAAESIADLPVECEWGCKRDSQGKTKFWKGGKAHVGTTRDGVPVAFVYTSANLHDSQAAIPLMKQASERLEYHFDLMDAAYDADPIRDESRELGHVPIIDFNARRSPEERRMSELEKEIYKDRSAAERVFSHLLDAHGGRSVRVRAPKKIALHLLLGIIVIAVEQTIRMLC